MAALFLPTSIWRRYRPCAYPHDDGGLGETAERLFVADGSGGACQCRPHLAELAKAHAESEWEKYRIVQDRLYTSDFDRFVQLEERAADKEKGGEQ